jgi:hypothetical protein
VRFAVESWAAEYGAPVDDVLDLATPSEPPDLGVEMPIDHWAPQSPDASVEPAGTVLFTDGVRRIDARVWITDGDATRLGVCASYAAGLVRAEAPRPDAVTSGPASDTTPAHRRTGAQVIAVDVDRGLFTGVLDAEPIATRHAVFAIRRARGDEPDQLSLALQDRMGELEVALAAKAAGAEPADLIVIDGPLRGRQFLDHAIGYVKTHHVAYLPPVVAGVIADLEQGQRTPLFLTTTSWSRYSWYLRLPGPVGHPWAGVVRCEASADLDSGAAVALADRSAVTLPRFASRAHKDPRAPQNLYPIAGLERVLRHRLGDPGLIYRGLREAAA